ncbi:hypothetical protein BN132_852 [Cronobacter turicensis 564]|nr:hypothetical protein BN132_852 [Cronobacter turicensis 564]
MRQESRLPAAASGTGTARNCAARWSVSVTQKARSRAKSCPPEQSQMLDAPRSRCSICTRWLIWLTQSPTPDHASSWLRFLSRAKRNHACASCKDVAGIAIAHSPVIAFTGTKQ